MFDWTTLGWSFLSSLLPMGCIALAGWSMSVMRKNVTLVDSLWSLFFLSAVLFHLHNLNWALTERRVALLVMVTLWALRLSGFLTWRNWSENEDRRYQEIRQNNEPYFWMKSLYLVFGLQVFLAWFISLPLLGGMLSREPLSALDYLGITLWCLGFFWESIADLQLAQFKSRSENQGRVMDRGLWRFSRHPNYFGEFTLWWGFYLFALSAGAWWSFPAPLLMSFLLLRVSGVSLLEKNISERRPDYVEYIRTTNSFFPWIRSP